MIPDLTFLCALLSVAVLVLGAIMAAIASQFEPVKPANPPDFLFRGFRIRPFAMELARNHQEIRSILGDYNRRNRAIMRNVQWAGFLLIAAWCALSIATALLMWTESFGYHRVLAVLTFLFAGAAAYVGGVSNRRILKILATPLMMSSASDVNGLARECWAAAMVKWIEIFIVMLLASTLFFFGFGGWYLIPGFCLVITAGRGFWGLWYEKQLKREGKIENVLNYILLTLIALFIAFLARGVSEQ